MAGPRGAGRGDPGGQGLGESEGMIHFLILKTKPSFSYAEPPNPSTVLHAPAQGWPRPTNTARENTEKRKLPERRPSKFSDFFKKRTRYTECLCVLLQVTGVAGWESPAHPVPPAEPQGRVPAPCAGRSCPEARLPEGGLRFPQS